MFGWLQTKLRNLQRQRNNQVGCQRCRSFYAQYLQTCDVCSQLSDAQLEMALRARRGFRLTLATGMLTGALLLILVMVLLTLD